MHIERLHEWIDVLVNDSLSSTLIMQTSQVLGVQKGESLTCSFVHDSWQVVTTKFEDPLVGSPKSR